MKLALNSNTTQSPRKGAFARALKGGKLSLQFSISVRNAMLDAIETAISTSAQLAVFTGSQPANCATANSGTELVRFSLPSDWAANAASGSKSFNAVPISATATGIGTAAHYRIFASDGVTCHEQGTVTATGGGGDVTIDNSLITSGQPVSITAFTKTAPGA